MNEASNLECHALAADKLLLVLRMSAVSSHSRPCSSRGWSFLGYLTPKAKGTSVLQNVGNQLLVAYQKAWIFGSTAAGTLNLVQWIFIYVTFSNIRDLLFHIHPISVRFRWLHILSCQQSCYLYLSYEHNFIVAVIGRFIACLSVSNAATCLSCGAHDLAINC